MKMVNLSSDLKKCTIKKMIDSCAHSAGMSSEMKMPLLSVIKQCNPEALEHQGYIIGSMGIV